MTIYNVIRNELHYMDGTPAENCECNSFRSRDDAIGYVLDWMDKMYSVTDEEAVTEIGNALTKDSYWKDWEGDFEFILKESRLK